MLSPSLDTRPPDAPPAAPNQTAGAHVALFMHSFAGGGAERVMVNLAHGLAARGLRVDLVVVRAEGPYKELLSPDVRLINLNCRRSPASLPALARYLRRERPAALLSAMGVPNLTALWARRLARFRGRVVVSVHVNLSAHYQHAGLGDRIFPPLFRRFYPTADATVAVSEDMADDLKRAFRLPPAKVRTIYNPVVTDALRESARGPVPHPWLAVGQPPVVLSVGRLCPQKDFGTLLAAFARLRERLPSRLIILGEGPDRAALQSAVTEKGLTGSVALPGFQPNPYAYMACAAVYALSSRWEGLPTVLIEALACGSPVVSTDCPSGPREILGGGRWGRLVPVGDADALAGALEAAIREPNARPSPESWAEFEADRAAARYEQVLLESE